VLDDKFLERDEFFNPHLTVVFVRKPIVCSKLASSRTFRYIHPENLTEDTWAASTDVSPNPLTLLSFVLRYDRHTYTIRIHV